MADLGLNAQLPDDFSGVVRLFPLPDLVLFPGVVQPLHLFEPRYCDMVLDAMADDQLISMALLQPGWEADYEGCPPIAGVICIGRVINHTETGDGRHNILLQGLRRAMIADELPPLRSFRTARVDLLEDIYHDGTPQQHSILRRQLLDVCRQFVSKKSPAHEQFDQLSSSRVPLGPLADIVSFTTSLPVAFKQQLLSQCSVERRAEMLIEALQKLRAASELAIDDDSTSFPPPFSDN